jgi:hypothetical protein
MKYFRPGQISLLFMFALLALCTAAQIDLMCSLYGEQTYTGGGYSISYPDGGTESVDP